MKHTLENAVLTIFLEGEITAHNAAVCQEEVTSLLEVNPEAKVIFDAEGLTYISSAGLRIILSAYKKLGERMLAVDKVANEVYDVFEMTKFTELMNIQKANKKPRV